MPALGRKPPGRFGQGEAQAKDNQSADSDADPEAAPTNGRAQEQSEQGRNRPYHRAADKMDERQNPAAQALWRKFARIGEAQRLLCAKANARDKAKDGKPAGIRGKGARERRQTEEQKVELINGLAPHAIGELALQERSDREPG